MIGALFSLAAWAPAVIIARREPAYRPIRDSLTASLLHAALASEELDHRTRLALFASVPLSSLVAYAAAWGDRVDGAVTLLITCAALAWIGFAPEPASWWPWLTFGPLALAVMAGAGLLWASRRPMDLASLVCTVILATDAATCLAWRLGAVSAWQGRAQATLVALIELVWLFRARASGSPSAP